VNDIGETERGSAVVLGKLGVFILKKLDYPFCPCLVNKTENFADILHAAYAGVIPA